MLQSNEGELPMPFRTWREAAIAAALLTLFALPAAAAPATH